MRRHLFENQNDIFYRLDVQGNFETISYACYAHWGYMPHELVGKPCWEMIITTDANNVNQQVKNTQHKVYRW